jgi:phosphatidylinositol phospholipase C gamma-1
MSPRECEQWVRGLRFLIEDTLKSSYSLQVEIWLRKEFNATESSKSV